MITNNVTRLLDSRKIPYTAFELPIEKIGALEAAQRLNVAPEQVFKTIVVIRTHPGKTILAIIPGPGEVNVKKLAAILGEKKVQIPTLREAEEMTHLQAGGISPLALINKGFQSILDESAMKFEQIHISGGQRGLNIRVPVKPLINLIQAQVADITLWPE